LRLLSLIEMLSPGNKIIALKQLDEYKISPQRHSLL